MGKGRGGDRGLVEDKWRQDRGRTGFKYLGGSFLLGLGFNKILKASFDFMGESHRVFISLVCFIMLRIKPRALTGQAIREFYHQATSLVLQNIPFYSSDPRAVPLSECRSKMEYNFHIAIHWREGIT